MNDLDQLTPRPVWAHFAALCRIPRPSKHEQRLREHLLAWAADLGIAREVDAAGNLLLRKPATPGYEHCPGVILQGHLDMVCQKNSDVTHDFFNDPIRPQLLDGWLVAPDTTLGADNGIGVALALAALEADDLVHPPLEVLLTVDEEAGMGGVRGVAAGSLHGKWLLNLDTEEWGKVYVGCAGGLDVKVRVTVEREPVAAGRSVCELMIGGLRGGHSGIDIHRGRGNAIKLLADLLASAPPAADLRLIDMTGGTARNALPRECRARVSVAAGEIERLRAHVAQWQRVWQQRLAEQDPGLSADWRPVPGLEGTTPEAAGCRQLTRDAHDRWLSFLLAAPYGVRAMSRDFPGVVETSNNLGVTNLREGIGDAVFMVRSLHAPGYDRLAAEIATMAEAAGGQAVKEGTYPAWTPDPASPLLTRLQHAYASEFGAPAQVEIIHAGLECGLLSASHPQVQMISFGPDIRGAHAPGERVNVTSVGLCWRLLRRILADLAAS